MKHHIIMMEGLPGTGKSTLARWLNNYLEHHGISTNLLLEGDNAIPADYYETAVLTREEYATILNTNDSLHSLLKNHTTYSQHYAYIPLEHYSDPLYSMLQDWNMGDELNTNFTINDYITCTLERLVLWKDELTNSNVITIVDGGFLQNPINQLLFRGANTNIIFNFILNLFQLLTPLNPVCIYLERKSPREALTFAKKMKGDAWTKIIEQSLNAIHCEDFFEQRFELEAALLNHLPNILCKIEGYDWASAKHSISTYFSI